MSTIVITKHQNNKLYNYEDKCYTNLGGVYDCVINGDEVMIYDHKTGLDITAPVLCQVLGKYRLDCDVSSLHELIKKKLDNNLKE